MDFTLLGCDFTSAPTRRKPIVLAVGRSERGRVLIDAIEGFESLDAWGERLIGLLIMILACILSLPIPGGNFMPTICICILALAVLERDGLFGIIGLVVIASLATFMIKLIVLSYHMVTGWFSDFF